MTPPRGSGRRLVIEADGGSRGNPGVAGYGALVRDPATGSVLVELAEPLGQASNNVAEYSGLLAGLQTQPAVLGFATETMKSDEPNVSYATVYPLATITKLVLAQLLLGFGVAG